MNRVLQVQLGRVRNFLYSPKFKRFLVFLFFLFVSAGFWMLQTLRDTLEMRISLPVVLQDVPEDVMITSAPPEEVELNLRDKGTILVQYLYQKKLQPLELSFTNYDNKKEADRVIVPHGDLLRLLQPQLEGSTRVLEAKPDTMEYYYTRGLPKRMPVKVLGHVTTTAQNYLMDLHAYPDSMDVYAPRAVMDTMQYAYTAQVDWTNLTDTKTDEVALMPMRGVKYDTPIVQVKATVGYYIEKTVEIPVVGMNFPADKMLRVFPSRVKVTFRVGEAESSRPWEELFVLVLTYEELMENQGSKVRLQLKTVPEGVSNPRLQPQEVDYLIEHRETATPE